MNGDDPDRQSRQRFGITLRLEAHGGRRVTDLVPGTTILRRSDAKVVERGSTGVCMRRLQWVGKH